MNLAPTCPSGTPAHGESVNRLGLWVFLATEVLFFGGLFLAYAVYRAAHAAAFSAASARLDFPIGTVNTGVLLTSSLAVALADLAARGRRVRSARAWLVVAGLLGAVFLTLKGFEYHAKFAEHLVPGPGFAFAGPPPAELFFSLYFAMTGLHAVHLLAGLGALAWLWVRLGRHPTGDHTGAVELTGLYWHFVDCVWVFLYPLLYLIPPAP
ncbi:MAG TPA: cytochrome c oxidase subunit 3 [Lacunisphaera sp.]|nr:cytochrome c oxidase subunit 3 [Lacunisphaera sp.]